MAGTAVTAGMLAVAVTLTAGLGTVASAAIFGQRLAGAADAAALAAADTVSGALPGSEPCDRAATVAAADGARLGRCELDGLVATIRVDGAFLSFPASAWSRAGPPPEAPHP